MTEEQKEELLTCFECTANFLRGMCFDMRVPTDIRDAINAKVNEIEQELAKHDDFR